LNVENYYTQRKKKNTILFGKFVFKISEMHKNFCWIIKNITILFMLFLAEKPLKFSFRGFFVMLSVWFSKLIFNSKSN